MSEFTSHMTSLNDVLLIESVSYEDSRGFFCETYQRERFANLGISAEFVQDNHSGSHRGVLRGLHYQIRQTQGKLVRVSKGEVYDVVVDLRRSSPTFGKWEGMVLSADNRRHLWIPPDFAHGFLVLSDWADVIYKVTDYYAPEYERTLVWNDPGLAIHWPVAAPPLISEKDRSGMRFAEAEVFE